MGWPSPIGAYQYVDVLFTDAHYDTGVAHSLPGGNVRWMVVSLVCLTGSPIEAPAVYANGGTGSRPPSNESLTLRCTIPQVRVRLLLFQEA